MSNRLDHDREKRIQPIRISHALEEIQRLGYAALKTSETTLTFMYKGEPVQFHAYSGWATGKTIKEVRGLNQLLKQIT